MWLGHGTLPHVMFGLVPGTPEFVANPNLRQLLPLGGGVGLRKRRNRII